MGLSVWITATVPTTVFDASITHNLGRIASAAGLYYCIWRPEEINIKTAGQLIWPLREGLAALKADPAKFEALNPSNGWGDYAAFVEFVEGYLRACETNPAGTIKVSR